MKLRMSRTTTTCPKGFVFLAFRPYWSSSQKRISGLSAPSKVKARPQVLQVVKATLWKCQRWLCERPVLKWCPCTTLPTSARVPGGAENLLLLLELIHRSSGMVTVTLIGQHIMVQLLPVSWPAAHAALGWSSCGSKSLLHNPALWYPEGKPPYCGCTALPKNKHTAGKEHTQMCTFFISTFFIRPMDVSGPLDMTLHLVLFWKSLRTQSWSTTNMHSLEMSILLAMCQC